MSTSDGAEPAARPRARHLMDPAAPRRMADDTSLTRVQRRVLSALVVTTILHLSVGLVVAAVAVPEGETAARVGLNIIGAAFGVLAVASGFLIHQRSALSPWLLLGVLPGVVGLWIVLS